MVMKEFSVVQTGEQLISHSFPRGRLTTVPSSVVGAVREPPNPDDPRKSGKKTAL